MPQARSRRRTGAQEGKMNMIVLNEREPGPYGPVQVPTTPGPIPPPPQSPGQGGAGAPIGTWGK